MVNGDFFSSFLFLVGLLFADVSADVQKKLAQDKELLGT